MQSAPTTVLREITFQASWPSLLSSMDGHSWKKERRSEDGFSICASLGNRTAEPCFTWCSPKSCTKVKRLQSQPTILLQRTTTLLLGPEAVIFISKSTPASI